MSLGTDPDHHQPDPEYYDRMAEHMMGQLHRQYMTTAMLWEHYLAREREILEWRDRRVRHAQLELELG